MRVFLSLCLLLFSSFAAAQMPTDEAMELRAREVGRALRCVVCQNQSIEESDASLAKDMRVIVREQMAQGQTNREVINYMRDRYGDYVLLKPPLQSNTYALWFLPALVIFGMAAWLFWFTRRRRDVTQTTDDLNEDERKILARVMDET